MSIDTPSVTQYEARILPLLDGSLEKYKLGGIKALRDILSILNTQNVLGILTLLHCMRKRAVQLSKIDIYPELQNFSCWNNVKVVENYLLFLNDLVSADGRIVGSVFAILLNFLKNSQLCTDDPNFQIPDESLTLVYSSFQKIITLVPRGYTLLWNELTFHAPHHESERVIGYVKILMQIALLCPLLRDRIIAFIVEKAIHLDVEIKLEDLEEDEQNDVQFEFEKDQKSLIIRNRIKKSADKLDAIMLLLFTDIDDQNSQEDRQSLDETFKLYLKIFDAAILLTHHCKIVQFLLFYLCSLKKDYTIEFLNCLLSKYELSTNSLITRSSAISYLGSFLARANFLRLKTIKKTLVVISELIKKFIDTDENEAPLDSEECRLFYTTCGHLFYMICFQHWKLFKNPKKGLAFCERLEIGKIVTNPLNPLHNCTGHVAHEFVKVCKYRNIGNWANILYKNKKLIKSTPLENFPFDPYLLKNSSEFVNNIYNCWRDVTDEEEEEEDDEQDQEEEEESEIPKPMSFEEISYDLEYQFGYP